jgi:DNA-binding NtrC family response regulator
MERTLQEDALAALNRHSWPGNVRELRNVVQRAAIESGDRAISAADVGNILS